MVLCLCNKFKYVTLCNKKIFAVEMHCDSLLKAKGLVDFEI